MSRSVQRTASFVLVLAALLASMAGVASAAAPVPAAFGAAPAALSTGQPFSAAAVPRPAGLPASAKLVTSTPPPAGKVYIVNQWTGRCLDAFYSDSGGNGNPVGQWYFTGHEAQLWYLYYLST